MAGESERASARKLSSVILFDNFFFIMFHTTQLRVTALYSFGTDILHETLMLGRDLLVGLVVRNPPPQPQTWVRIPLPPLIFLQVESYQ